MKQIILILICLFLSGCATMEWEWGNTKEDKKCQVAKWINQE